MEATSDYWKPFSYLLEDLPGVEVMLVNARHVKNLPGRKSDVADATWLAQLGAHGLVRASFVPPAPIRVLRDLTRARTAIPRVLADLAKRRLRSKIPALTEALTGRFDEPTRSWPGSTSTSSTSTPRRSRRSPPGSR